MAVDLDVIGSFQFVGPTITTFNDTSITVGTNINRVLVYAINFSWSGSQPSGIALAWDPSGTNQSLSLIAQNLNGGSACLSQLWGLVAPTSGNKTLTASWTNNADNVKAIGIAFYGCNQIGGATTFDSTATVNGSSTSPSATVTTSSNDAAVGTSCTIGSNSSYSSTNHTVLFQNNNGAMAAEASYEINGSTAVMSCTAGPSTDWTYVATNIKAEVLSHTDTISSNPELIGMSFTGNFGSGTVVATGLRTGDKLIWLESSSYQDGNVQMNTSGYFEIIVSADDQIQQLNNTDLSNWAFNAIFVRGL